MINKISAFICGLADTNNLNLSDDDSCYFSDVSSFDWRLEKFQGSYEEGDCCVYYCQTGKVIKTIKSRPECITALIAANPNMGSKPMNFTCSLEN